CDDIKTTFENPYAHEAPARRRLFAHGIPGRREEERAFLTWKTLQESANEKELRKAAEQQHERKEYLWPVSPEQWKA
ncbi:hypothetical protein LTS12_029008, partial [Elasticomyces elasticus]